MIDYNKALYRRNNAGQPTIWYGKPIHSTPFGFVEIQYGILGKTITKETIKTRRDPVDELQSKTNAKRKSGYKMLSEVSDSTSLPVEEKHIIAFLDTYLLHDRATSSGIMLPMLAKLYDNKGNKMFKDNKCYYVQPKLNGLRCLIGAKINTGDIFKPIKLVFQSREGTIWESLGNSFDSLEDYLLDILPDELLNKMVDEHYLLDGELYLYGHTVNEINSFVKDPRTKENKLLQFWCYDIAIPNMSQTLRLELLDEFIGDKCIYSLDHITHSSNKKRLVLVPTHECSSNTEASLFRYSCITAKFEGLILRDPDAENDLFPSVVRTLLMR